ncbi:MAG: LysR family transcriptional regulator, partial [Verrucomicrobiaceae bacterium]
SERFILMKEGHCLGAQALNFCHQGKLEPNVVLRSAQIETIHALVAAGFGVSLIPSMACGMRSNPSLVCRSLSAPKPERVIALCFRKGAYLSRAALRLIDFLHQTAKERSAAS